MIKSKKLKEKIKEQKREELLHQFDSQNIREGISLKRLKRKVPLKKTQRRKAISQKSLFKVLGWIAEETPQRTKIIDITDFKPVKKEKEVKRENIFKKLKKVARP